MAALAFSFRWFFLGVLPVSGDLEGFPLFLRDSKRIKATGTMLGRVPTVG